MEVIEGNVINSYAKNATFTPTAIPCVYLMRMGGLAAGERTFNILGDSTGPDNIKGDYPHSRFPQDGDDGWIRVALDPYPSTNTLITLTAYKVSKVYYADAEHGDDAWDGTTDYEHRDEANKHGPKQSLQAVYDVTETGSTSAGYPIVYVAPGVYSNGVTTTYSDKNKLTTGSSNPCNRRLVTQKGIGFIATGGPDKTFIVGAPDPETADGLGSNAVSGVHMSGNYACYLKGFTITGCYSPATQSANNQYGAAYCSGAYRNYLLDCVVSNNFAGKYSATCYGTMVRTKILENTSSQYVTQMGVFISCIFAGNVLTYGDVGSVGYSLHNGANTYFCTYDLRNRLNPTGRKQLHNTSTYLRGCLVYGLTADTVSTTYWKDSKAFDNPVFADADARDYRLGALSPALDASAYSNNLNSVARSVMTSDIDGRWPVVHDGRVRLGAVWNEPPLPVTVINSDADRISVTGAEPGTNVVSSTGPITVTATDFGSRNFIGFEVNGEMVSAPSGSYSFTPSTAAGSVTTVKAIYDTDWYVDCVNGSDANPGTASLPKKTIRAATTNAVSGDVIHVAPGTYGAAEGAEKYKEAATSRCRVIIPAGVTVESTEGAKKTFIVGAPAEEDADGVGNGPGAVRCVYAGNRATLTGFTLTGGHTAASKTADDYDIYGAALLTGKDSRANINDCIISNNYSNYATIFQSAVKRSRIIGNIGGTGTGTGADAVAGSGCSYISCIIGDNKGNGTIRYPTRLESCTVGKNLMHNDGSAQVLSGYNTSCALLNSLFTYAQDRFYSITLYATNCIFRRGTTADYGLTVESCPNCRFNTSVSMTGYRPDYGSIAIDGGSNEIARIDIASETDVYGTPRALNGRIDIGAVEYDWRPKFAQELGKRVTIDYASPSVATNATGGLVMPSGEVAGRVTAGGKYSFTFDIPSGTVEAFVGGVSAGTLASAGEQTITVDIPDAETEFRIVFTPDAETPEAAILKQIAANRGFVLIYR